MTSQIENSSDMSGAFDTRLNSGDLDGLMALMAPGVVMRTPQGEVLKSAAAILENLSGLVRDGAHLENHCRHVLANGDVALMLIDWTLELRNLDTPDTTGVSTNIVTRDPDRGWLLTVLNPAGIS